MSTLTEALNVDVPTIDRALGAAVRRGADAGYINTLLDMRNHYAGLTHGDAA